MGNNRLILLGSCGKIEEIWKEPERMRIFQRNTLYLNDIWQINPDRFYTLCFYSSHYRSPGTLHPKQEQDFSD